MSGYLIAKADLIKETDLEKFKQLESIFAYKELDILDNIDDLSDDALEVIMSKTITFSKLYDELTKKYLESNDATFKDRILAATLFVDKMHKAIDFYKSISK